MFVEFLGSSHLGGPCIPKSYNGSDSRALDGVSSKFQTSLHMVDFHQTGCWVTDVVEFASACWATSGRETVKV